MINPLQLNTDGLVMKGAREAFLPAEEMPSTVSVILFLMEEATPFVRRVPQLSAKYWN